MIGGIRKERREPWADAGAADRDELKFVLVIGTRGTTGLRAVKQAIYAQEMTKSNKLIVGLVPHASNRRDGIHVGKICRSALSS